MQLFGRERRKCGAAPVSTDFLGRCFWLVVGVVRQRFFNKSCLLVCLLFGYCCCKMDVKVQDGGASDGWMLRMLLCIVVFTITAVAHRAHEKNHVGCYSADFFQTPTPLSSTSRRCECTYGPDLRASDAV